ncbi:glycosyl hydrolase 108 family protein [Magnetospira sp. QH-2]|uniref:glycosyl hydrolase 108 family protein n=1 Tax=Magnetospira sp. (strain QH-2) TaxID=1288970 RepID=UPI0009E41290|nr:glycosyl hydrolase 108 family protein [Magnetospira sp. QH-2]
MAPPKPEEIQAIRDKPVAARTHADQRRLHWAEDYWTNEDIQTETTAFYKLNSEVGAPTGHATGHAPFGADGARSEDARINRQRADDVIKRLGPDADPDHVRMVEAHYGIANPASDGGGLLGGDWVDAQGNWHDDKGNRIDLESIGTKGQADAPKVPLMAAAQEQTQGTGPATGNTSSSYPHSATGFQPASATGAQPFVTNSQTQSWSDMGQGKAYQPPETQVAQASPPNSPLQAPIAPTQPQSRADRTFQSYRKNLAPREGGYANRPLSVDKGGPTLKGMSQKALDQFRQNSKWKHLPKQSKNLTNAQIDQIYRVEYFDRPQLDKLEQVPGLAQTAPQLTEQIFDAGVQHGIEDAGRWLQESLDEVLGTDLRVTNPKTGQKNYDGIIGSGTRKTVEQAVQAGKIKEVNNRIAAKSRTQKEAFEFNLLLDAG